MSALHACRIVDAIHCIRQVGIIFKVSTLSSSSDVLYLACQMLWNYVDTCYVWTSWQIKLT